MGKYGNKIQRRSINGKAKKNPIKVTYISSPLKVKASNVSEFRAIVQELTGKNSDVKDFYYYNNNTYDEEEEEEEEEEDVLVPLADEANNNQAADNRDDDNKKIFSPTTTADDFLSHLTSSYVDQFDDDGSSFGFQSPANCTLSSYYYDNICTAT